MKQLEEPREEYIPKEPKLPSFRTELANSPDAGADRWFACAKDAGEALGQEERKTYSAVELLELECTPTDAEDFCFQAGVLQRSGYAAALVAGTSKIQTGLQR